MLHDDIDIVLKFERTFETKYREMCAEERRIVEFLKRSFSEKQESKPPPQQKSPQD